MILDKLKQLSIKSTCCNKKVNIELHLNHIDECENENEVKDLLYKKLDKKLKKKMSVQFNKLDKINI